MSTSWWKYWDIVQIEFTNDSQMRYHIIANDITDLIYIKGIIWTPSNLSRTREPKFWIWKDFVLLCYVDGACYRGRVVGFRRRWAANSQKTNTDVPMTTALPAPPVPCAKNATKKPSPPPSTVPAPRFMPLFIVAPSTKERQKMRCSIPADSLRVLVCAGFTEYKITCEVFTCSELKDNDHRHDSPDGIIP